MKGLHYIARGLICALAVLLASTTLHAEELRPFQVSYAARYGNLKADAERSLMMDAATQQWRFASKIHLRLFGTTVTELDEVSLFRWMDDLPVPARYEFHQRGVGKRSRTLAFNGDNQVDFTVNEQKGSLMLDEPAYDDLNSFLVLREQLRAGETDVSFKVVDRSELKTYRYQVVGEETLATPAGRYQALHVSRVRDAGNARTTDLWLAPQHDYILLKLVQDEPDSDTITLELERGTLDGEELRGDQ